MLELTDNELQETINAGRSLIMFYTDWCVLCPRVRQTLKELESETGTDFRLILINFDKCPESVKGFKIPGVPTVLSVKDGELIDSRPGLRDDASYREMAVDIGAFGS